VKEDTAGFLDKAARAGRSAERALADGDAETAVRKSDQAMFYVAEALLIEKGLRFRKHAGVHAALARHFVRT
jgi:uncharacterized protein (UPF0332 family)